MLRLSCKIVIGSLVFSAVHQLEIESSIADKTSTCIIRLAKRTNVVNGQTFEVKPIQDVIKRGDRVEVYLGYDDNLKLEFLGYVRAVQPKVPLAIECEDEMFVLKQTEVAPKVFNGGNISDVIKYIAPAVKADILDSSLGGTFKILNDSPTALRVLEKIDEVYGLKSSFFLKDNQPLLVVGLQNSQKYGEVQYDLQRNVIDNALVYQDSEDVRVKVKASSLQADGTTIKETIGDQDGDVKTFAAPGLTREQLKQYATRIYRQSKDSRFDGDLNAFGIPFCQKGFTVLLTGEEVGSVAHQVESCRVTFGVNGFRRRISLGVKV